MRIEPEHVRSLKAAAQVFQEQDTPSPDAHPFYDMLSDAILWSDELPEELPEGWTVVRCVFRHRTCLLLGIEPEYEEWWQLARKLFPAWAGFAEERRQPSQSLQELYRTQRQAAIESLDRLWPVDGEPPSD